MYILDNKEKNIKVFLSGQIKAPQFQVFADILYISKQSRQVITCTKGIVTNF